MVSPGVKSRVERFYRALNKLKRLSSIDYNEYLVNDDLIDIAERNLQVAIEALIDVGEYVISQLRWRAPKSYRDIARILYENRLIDDEEYKILDNFIALRNIIIHNYTFLTVDYLFDSIRKFSILNEIMENILEYLEKRNIDP